jgi:hypothetical protein
MRDIAALLFGTEPGEPGARGDPHEPRELREPHERREEAREAREACVPGDARGWDSPPAPAGDWCQSSPGRGTLEWLGLTLGSRHRPGPLYPARNRTR